MNLPKLKKTIDGRKRQRATTFEQALGGYNHNLRTKAGEFYDMENISLDNYPVIGTRQGFAARYLEHSGTCNGIHEYKENTLMAVYGTHLYVGITATSEGSEAWYYDYDDLDEHGLPRRKTYQLENSAKTFATIGTKTLIMPDKVIYDQTGNTSNTYNVEKQYRWDYIESPSCYLMLRTVPCDIDGAVTSGSIKETLDDPPSNPSDGDWWYRAEDRTWYEYDTSGSEPRWKEIEKPYTRLIPVLTSNSVIFEAQYTGITEGSEPWEELNAVNEFFRDLKVLDSLNITKTYMDGPDLDTIEPVDYVVYGKRDVGGWGHQWDLNHTLTSIVIAEQATTNLVIYDIRIKCPDIGHIFSLNNRIWGVTPNYTEDEDEPEIHYPKASEIFACKLGDPTQWYNYPNTAADSFALTLGNDTEVTAACAYNNTPHFFTEDSLLKVYGDYPSNYQTREFTVDGVVSGGDKTLVQVEGLLFWVSPVGVEAYEGSLPYLVGQDFEPNFLNGKTLAAGKDGTKYVLSVSHNGESDGIFAFDTQNGMWAKLAEGIMREAAELKNALCYADQNGYLVTLYDRSLNDDHVPNLTNLFDMSNRTEGGTNYSINESKYYIPLIINSNGSGVIDSSSLIKPEWEREATASISENVLTVKSKVEYWEDEDYSGKDVGIAFPVNVTPGKKYVLYYNTSDATNARVLATIRNANNERIGGRTNIPSGTIITMPANAANFGIVFCQRALTDNNFSSIIFREVGRYDEEPIEWELETGNLGLDTPDQKYISRVQMRIDFIGSLNVDISYDDSEYLPVHVSQSDHMHSITVPIKVRRCDHFKLKLSGTGQMRLYSFGYETDEGSARCLI